PHGRGGQRAQRSGADLGDRHRGGGHGVGERAGDGCRGGGGDDHGHERGAGWHGGGHGVQRAGGLGHGQPGHGERLRGGHDATQRHAERRGGERADRAWGRVDEFEYGDRDGVGRRAGDGRRSGVGDDHGDERR